MRLRDHSRPTRARNARAIALATVGIAAASVGACGGGADSGKQTAARSVKPDTFGFVGCKAPLEDAVGVAVTAYVAQAKPKPQRFLVATGGADALGDGGLRALQDKGPTYLFPNDAALQSQARAMLHEKGDYTTLLVRRRSASMQKNEASVALEGEYVGGDENGQRPGPRTFRLGCEHAGDSTRWHVKNSSAEGHA